MIDREGPRESTWDPVLIGSLLIPAVLFPVPAYAVQVGCFFTALLLGAMFLVGLGITAVVKHFLAKYVWKVPKTPWLRMFGLTWLEFLLAILVFALVRTSYWVTVVIYLPAATLMNRALLARVRQPSPESPSFLQRNGIFLLLPLALPVSIQIAGVLWSSLTNMITFTEIR